MRLKPGHWPSLLAGGGLLAPALTFGIWAFGDSPGGLELMGGPGATLSFLLLLITPVIILGSALLGRAVLSYLEEDEGGSVEDGPARPGRSPAEGSDGARPEAQRPTLARLVAAAKNPPI
jgi:hypothetical protein